MFSDKIFLVDAIEKKDMVEIDAGANDLLRISNTSGLFKYPNLKSNLAF